MARVRPSSLAPPSPAASPATPPAAASATPARVRASSAGPTYEAVTRRPADRELGCGGAAPMDSPSKRGRPWFASAAKNVGFVSARVALKTIHPFMKAHDNLLMRRHAPAKESIRSDGLGNTAKVSVQLVSAADLRTQSAGGGSNLDPYCVVTVGRKGLPWAAKVANNPRKTFPIVLRNRHPRWNAHALLGLSEEVQAAGFDRELTVRVMDAHALRRDSVLGEARVQLLSEPAGARTMRLLGGGFASITLRWQLFEPEEADVNASPMPSGLPVFVAACAFWSSYWQDVACDRHAAAFDAVVAAIRQPARQLRALRSNRPPSPRPEEETTAAAASGAAASAALRPRGAAVAALPSLAAAASTQVITGRDSSPKTPYFPETTLAPRQLSGLESCFPLSERLRFQLEFIEEYEHPPRQGEAKEMSQNSVDQRCRALTSVFASTASSELAQEPEALGASCDEEGVQEAINEMFVQAPWASLFKVSDVSCAEEILRALSAQASLLRPFPSSRVIGACMERFRARAHAFAGPLRPLVEQLMHDVFTASVGRELMELKGFVDTAGSDQSLLAVCRAITNERLQASILDHFREEAAKIEVRPIHVLSDIDMTVWVGHFGSGGPKFPSGPIPGAISLFGLLGGRITFLSARPPLWEARTRSALLNDIGIAEANILQGTLQNVVMATVNAHKAHLGMGQEKERKFTQWAAIYPEAIFVFFGDSGEGDIDFARAYIASGNRDRGPMTPASNQPVVGERTCSLMKVCPDRIAFIHDVVCADGVRPKTGQPERAALRNEGVYVFDTYVDAALRLYRLAVIDEWDLRQAIQTCYDELREVPESAYGSPAIMRARWTEMRRDIRKANLLLESAGQAAAGADAQLPHSHGGELDGCFSDPELGGRFAPARTPSPDVADGEGTGRRLPPTRARSAS